MNTEEYTEKLPAPVMTNPELERPGQGSFSDVKAACNRFFERRGLHSDFAGFAGLQKAEIAECRAKKMRT